MTQADTKGTRGNTNNPRHRKWFFTWNNYELAHVDTLLDKFSEAEKYIFQEEKGENGTPHLQGCVEFSNARSFTSMKKIHDKIHWEPTKNGNAAIEYCCKEATRNGQIWSKNIAKKYNGSDLIKELRPWQQEIANLIRTKPDNRKVYWYWEPNGNMGKSSLGKYLAFHNSNVCLTTATKSADILTCVDPIYDTYIFDFPRCLGDFLPFTAIEQLKNGFITDSKLKKKARMLMFDPPHVIIFSNYEPDKDKLSADRWVIKKIDNPE